MFWNLEHTSNEKRSTKKLFISKDIFQLWPNESFGKIEKYCYKEHEKLER